MPPRLSGSQPSAKPEPTVTKQVILEDGHHHLTTTQLVKEDDRKCNMEDNMEAGKKNKKKNLEATLATRENL